MICDWNIHYRIQYTFAACFLLLLLLLLFVYLLSCLFICFIVSNGSKCMRVTSMRKKNERETVSITNKFHSIATVRCSNGFLSYLRENSRAFIIIFIWIHFLHCVCVAIQLADAVAACCCYFYFLYFCWCCSLATNWQSMLMWNESVALPKQLNASQSQLLFRKYSRSHTWMN